MGAAAPNGQSQNEQQLLAMAAQQCAVVTVSIVFLHLSIVFVNSVAVFVNCVSVFFDCISSHTMDLRGIVNCASVFLNSRNEPV